MKLFIRSIFLLLAVILVMHCKKDELIHEPVLPDINKNYIAFKDHNLFKTLIERGVDTDGDDSISIKEAEAVLVLDLDSCGITDMTGIEKFINLNTLMCDSNYLHALNVSNNSQLEVLACVFNVGLTALDVSDNAKLKWIDCSKNQISDLNVSGTLLWKR